jgi:O-antigen/teichoic acid export membrane protein
MNKKLLTDILVVSSSRNVLLGLSFIRNLLIARLFQPEEYGFWVIISLIMTYGDQIHLGYRHAGDREIPFYTGRAETHVVRNISNTIYTGILNLGLIGFLAVTLYGSFALFLPSHVRIALIITGTVILSDQFNRFYFMILRTRKEFVLSTKLEIFFEIIRTISVGILVYLMGLIGVVIAFTLASILTSVYFHITFRQEFKLHFDKLLLRKLLKVGFLLSLSGLFYLLIISVDRIVVSAFYDKAALGIYGLASLVMQLPSNSSQGIQAVLYPTLSQQYGEGGDKEKSYFLFRNILIILAYLLPLLIAALFFFCEFFIPVFLGSYTNSIPIMEILYYGIFFLGLSPIPIGFLMASGENLSLIKIEVITLIIGLPCILILMHLNHSVSSIAVGTDIMFFIYLTAMLWKICRTHLNELTKRLIVMVEIYSPGIISMVVAFLVNYFIYSKPGSSPGGLLITMLEKIIVFGFLYSPVLIYAHRVKNIFGAVVKSYSAV